MIKVVYTYNLKPGVNKKEFEDYYFNQRISQVMKVPNLKKFTFNIAVGAPEGEPRYRYMAECYYEDLKIAKETLDSEYFKDVHGYIASKLTDLNIAFYKTHEWIPAEENKR